MAELTFPAFRARKSFGISGRLLVKGLLPRAARTAGKSPGASGERLRASGKPLGANGNRTGTPGIGPTGARIGPVRRGIGPVQRGIVKVRSPLGLVQGGNRKVHSPRPLSRLYRAFSRRTGRKYACSSDRYGWFSDRYVCPASASAPPQPTDVCPERRSACSGPADSHLARDPRSPGQNRLSLRVSYPALPFAPIELSGGKPPQGRGAG